MNKTIFYNGRMITPEGIYEDGCLIVEEGRIKYVGKDKISGEDYRKIDVKGDYISAGFIDIHTHGGGGHDFMDGTPEAFLGAAEKHAQHGTTTLLPTTIACEKDELKNTFKVFKEARSMNTKGAGMPGLHLEGPYFSMEQRGAQDPKYVKRPDPEEYLEILTWSDDIIRWSAAPELPGALEFGRHMRDRGILPSIAHTNATYEEVLPAWDNGYSHVTHLYSGMSGVRRINAYRYAGVIESAYLLDDMTVEIIADGVHLPESLLKLIYKIKGPDHIALVTDSMRAAGMPEGESILGSLQKGQKVIVEDGVAKLTDRSAFAGSVATADRLVRTMIKIAGVPVQDAVKMITATPARIMGFAEDKGSLLPGMDADIVVFDENINVKLTMINGKVVHSS